MTNESSTGEKRDIYSNAPAWGIATILLGALGVYSSIPLLTYLFILPLVPGLFSAMATWGVEYNEKHPLLSHPWIVAPLYYAAVTIPIGIMHLLNGSSFLAVSVSATAIFGALALGFIIIGFTIVVTGFIIMAISARK